VHFHYTPTSPAWSNQVDLFSASWASNPLGAADFALKSALRDHIEARLCCVAPIRARCPPPWRRAPRLSVTTFASAVTAARVSGKFGGEQPI
jgi:hypothetical protein